MLSSRAPVLLLPTALAALVLVPAGALAAEAAPQAAETSVAPPAAEASPAPTEAPPAEAPAASAPQPAAPAAPAAAAPQVQKQFAQGDTRAAPGAARRPRRPASAPAPAAQPGAAEGALAGARARLPSGLTPSLPPGLISPLAGVPSFFIESFRIPPFLLAIYQAAGTAYGIPWQVLAAINEVETDYGRDLSVSSAGAEGWMQFLPSSWAQFGVDANGDGFEDPYNPADAIFAAARYLHAAGGAHDIKGAVFSYNHSQAYVESVLLRAQLLSGTPPELLGAITALTEARFPVHAAAHFSDAFPLAPARGSRAGGQLVGTSIYSQAGAPVVAVQDGRVSQIGDSPQLGRFLVLRDAYGNRYTYGHLGDIAALYPVLEPHVHSSVTPRIPEGAHEPTPSGPATAGAQPRSPFSEAGTIYGLTFGAAAGLEAAPAKTAQRHLRAAPARRQRVFRSGVNDVFLRPLRAGVQVIAGTVLGHVGGAGAGAGAEGAAHIIFQIRPGGASAPLIDPKPILDGWVALENTSIFRARGENPFLATAPTVGQVLLESKQQLEPQVLRDGGIRLGRCGRADVQAGRVDRRVLALLEYMSVSALKPTASGLRCPPAGAPIANATADSSAQSVNITAINGVPVAGHQGSGSLTDTAVRRLLMLQGAARPTRILSQLGYPGGLALASPRAGSAIDVSFAAGPAARAAASGSELAPAQWVQLVARLGEIPDPTVARAPSQAAIADAPAAQEGGAGGNH